MSYPPPPQGGYPQQPQQPYPQQGGYAYPPQQPYPQQGGYAYPPPQQPQQPQWGPPPPGPIPPAPAQPQGDDSDDLVKNLLKIVAILALVGALWWLGSWLTQDDAKNAEVGNCMQNTGTAGNPNLDIVDCGSSDAQYKVIEVHENTTATSVCKDGSIGYYETSGRKRRRTSVVLCLTELTK